MDLVLRCDNSTHARRFRGVPRARGFSQLELLVVVLILAVLAALLVPALAGARRSAQSVNCISNLRQIALGFQQYASVNGGRLPDPPAVNLSWEAVILNFVGDPAVYRCPGDDELAPSIGSSYDWRDTGDPVTTLAGRFITDSKVPNPVLVYDCLPDWHRKGKMNAAFLDGSATSVDTRTCLADLMTPIRSASGQPTQSRTPR
jgi:prepilin-type N-terminal cleavage/methylation domain-containing protein/prepilin-type processing-associated H-X9-DG protein